MWLSPLAWLLLALSLMVLESRLRRGSPASMRMAKWVRPASRVLAVAALAGMTPLVANVLTKTLEAASPADPDCRSHPPAVAVLLAGGTTSTPAGPRDDSVLGLSSRRRADAAARWWAAGNDRRLWVSGGTPSGSGIPESELLATYLQARGVPKSALRMEVQSRTTRESAQRLWAMPRAELPGHVTLLTSALHMPRAVAAMTAVGFAPCPHAMDRRGLPVAFPGMLIPQLGAAAKTQSALHELVGRAYYRLLDAKDAARR